MVFDALGRTTSVSDDGTTTEYTYDSRGNVLTVIQDEEVTTYTYSDNGNLASITNPDSTVAGYTYDTYGNLTGHNYNGYQFTYNTLGSILTASSESGQLVNYTYSDTIEQEVLTSNFGNGQSIVYEYNDDREITAIKLGEETKYGYAYLEATDEYGDITEEWTELTDYVSGLKKIIEDSKTTVNDLNGNFIYSVEDVLDDYDGKKITVGDTVYTLVAEENKDTFKTNGTTDFTKEYTYVNDELTKVETAGVTTSYSYNADKLISVLENTLNDVSKAYGYTYGDNGNITTETVTTKDTNGNVVAGETVTYTYDDKEQLTSAENSTTRWNYSYDNRGNILSKSETDLTSNATVTDTYVYDEFWKDKLISYNGQTITYDASGNPTSYLGNTLTWTMGRQLASFNDIEFTYDENGIRTSKKVDDVTTMFYLDDTNIIEQRTGTDVIHFYYDSNDEVIGFKYNGNNYFYVKNLQGDITDIVNANGEIVSSYVYDPWGDILSISGDTTIGNLNPFRYRSYYYDADIDLYYLQSRYYDAEIGRFINSDDVNYIGLKNLAASYNAFTYCENNPVNNSDQYGRISVKTFFAMVALTSAVYNRFLCARLYMWGFTHRKKNQTYDFSKNWEDLLIRRLKNSKAIKEAINFVKKKLLKPSGPKSYTYRPKINFYNYIKQSISDIDLILSIGGGGDIWITVYRTNKKDKGKVVYDVRVVLSNEVFDFGYWKMKIFGITFGKEEAHSKNQLVTLINNVGYYTQNIGAFVKFTWKFVVNFSVS